MKKKLNYNILLTVLVLLGIAISVSSPNFFTNGSEKDAKDQAKDFSLLDLSGNPVTLSGLAGKPVILNFWATWCPPCVAEMPALNEIYLEHKESGLVVLGVNVGENEEWVGSFIKKLNITFPILLDPASEVNDKYGVYGLPTSFFLDRTGHVQEMIMGGASKEIFENRLKSIL